MCLLTIDYFNNHVLGTFYLELLARFELATRFPRNRGFVEALRPRTQILSAYADRADEAASFRMEDIKNDQGQTALVIFLELLARFELATSSLPRMRSTD